ncbi:hypothetical protein [Sulfitobacter faviae]|uniref:hypothetical protein n=1 Tax=Sulfitobacter faviae TaxID=1775881 RepID=UPI002457114F|nr:hypothetical protein [Sulfitobacter faviae]
MRLNLFIAKIALMLVGTTTGRAQDFGFQVSNGLTLEQVIVTQERTAGAPQSSGGDGSSAVISQDGEGNNAVSSISGSQNSGTLVLQQGNANDAIAVIQNSPGSAIAQAQLGSNNSSLAAIVGGRRTGSHRHKLATVSAIQ